jgi:hypothetical protein
MIHFRTNSAARRHRPAFLLFLAAITLPLAAHAQAHSQVHNPYNAQHRMHPLAATALLTGSVRNKQGQFQRRNYLALDQYEQVRDISLDILRRFPPKNYLYLTIGRSPTPIAAFLQNLNPELAVTIPASNLRANQTTGLEQAWYTHLDRFVPRNLIGKRTLLILDRSTTGSTLQKVQSIVQQWVAARGHNVSVEVIGLARQPNLPIPNINIADKPELVALNLDNYSPYSEWPEFEVGVTPVQQLVRQPSYDVFKSSMLQRMQRDAVLGQQLDELERPAK